MDGEEGQGSVLDCGEGLEGVGVGDGGVVEAGEGFGVDDAGHFGGDIGAGEGVSAAEGLGLRESFPEDGCDSTLVGVQIDVAAADGEAVGLTDSRDSDDFEIEVEVSGHAFYDDELLGVFLAEIGAVWPDYVEELGDDGGDADEVAGSRGAFVEVGDGAWVDLGGGAGVVHPLGGGGEDEAHPCGFEHGEVAVQVSGVGGEVLALAELGRVDEYGGGYGVVLCGGAFDEGHVASVEVAHGGDQAEGAGG